MLGTTHDARHATHVTADGWGSGRLCFLRTPHDPPLSRSMALLLRTLTHASLIRICICMAWYGFAQFLIPAAISYSVSLDIFRRHSPSSLPQFSSTLISPVSFCMFTIVFTTHTRLYPTHVSRPTFSPRPELFLAYLSIHTHAPCALSVFVLVLCI